MADFYRNSVAAKSSTASIDAGLRAYMVKVFSYMTLALGITGLVSYGVFSTNFIQAYFTVSPNGNMGFSGLGFLFTFAPVLFVLFFSYQINRVSISAAQLMLWIYAGLMGLSLAPVFAVYTGESIAQVFFITASVFGAMSLYGYSTKHDLTSMGSFLFMGLIGVLIASVVNMFLHSSAIQFITSIVTVLVFTGFTAYDVQRISQSYYAANGQDKSKVAILGALSLYMNFINIFLALLRLIGNRKD